MRGFNNLACTLVEMHKFGSEHHFNVKESSFKNIFISIHILRFFVYRNLVENVLYLMVYNDSIIIKFKHYNLLE